jgi:hypothetical protein
MKTNFDIYIYILVEISRFAPLLLITTDLLLKVAAGGRNIFVIYKCNIASFASGRRQIR